MPGPIQEDNGRRPVTCDRCGRVWWVGYSEAVKLMQTGQAWIAHRQERVGEVDNGTLGATPGKWEAVAYLKGLCDNCHHGVIRPSVEAESHHIYERTRHMLAVGVDPENATSYAIEEYQEEYARTFMPEFHSFWQTIGWAQRPTPLSEVDFSLLPPEFLGEELGLEDGSPRCPHVNPPVDWTQYNGLVNP